MRVSHHEGDLLARFDGKDALIHLLAKLTHVVISQTIDLEAPDNAGPYPLAYVVTSKIEPLYPGFAAVFDVSPQHLVRPFLRNGRDVLHSNPGGLLIWASPNNNGFAAVRA
jgi:hypothetical protein